MILKVYLHNKFAGTLDIQTSEPFFGFKYSDEYLSSPDAQPLSLSLPLVDSRFPFNQSQPFFEGLLPEGNARETVSRRLGIPLQSSVKLLQALGRDCAGAVSIINENEQLQPYLGNNDIPFNELYNPLNKDLESIAKNPLIIIPKLQEDMRLSLAGAQEKIALYHCTDSDIENNWFIPLKGMPSTHIIKPGLLEFHYPDITLNEFLCLRTAAACGIRTANADILFPETPILIIQRFDRLSENNPDKKASDIIRIHQEDFCQACGIKSSLKYEHDGGPGYKQIRNILTLFSKQPIDDITTFVKLIIFNYLIGNCDAHSKNFSIFHNPDETVSLTPAYDLICTAIYDGRFGSKLSRNMGMKIGLHENIDKINTEDFSLLSKNIQVNLNLIKQYKNELIEMIPDALKNAALIALNKGFTNAHETANRILTECYKRAGVI